MNIATFTDLRFTAGRNMTGVGKHIEQMVKGLHSNNNINVCALAASDQIEANDRIAGDNILNYLPATRLPLKWKTAEVLWTLAGGPAVDRYCQDADWVYCPKNDFIPLNNTKLAVTIHGAHELDPDMPKSPGLKSSLNRMRRRLSYQRIVKRADLILVVSNFLKKQVVEWFNADPDKIEVVGNGVEPVFFETAKMPQDQSDMSEQPYVLSVGGLNTIDGGESIINVAKTLRDRAIDIQVLVAGWQHNDRYLRQAKDLNNIKLLGYVPAAKLAKLIRDAIALLFLTRYETFGIAAVEAMAVGTPVITTGSTAVPEIVGGAGIYVNEDCSGDAVDKIIQLSNSSNLRKQYRDLGYKHAAKYTWQACVDRLVYAMKERS